MHHDSRQRETGPRAQSRHPRCLLPTTTGSRTSTACNWTPPTPSMRCRRSRAVPLRHQLHTAPPPLGCCRFLPLGSNSVRVAPETSTNCGVTRSSCVDRRPPRYIFSTLSQESARQDRRSMPAGHRLCLSVPWAQQLGQRRRSTSDRAATDDGACNLVDSALVRAAGIS